MIVSVERAEAIFLSTTTVEPRILKLRVARRRKIPFEVSIDLVKNLVSQNRVYATVSPSRIVRVSPIFTHLL